MKPIEITKKTYPILVAISLLGILVGGVLPLCAFFDCWINGEEVLGKVIWKGYTPGFMIKQVKLEGESDFPYPCISFMRFDEGFEYGNEIVLRGRVFFVVKDALIDHLIFGLIMIPVGIHGIFDIRKKFKEDEILDQVEGRTR